MQPKSFLFVRFSELKRLAGCSTPRHQVPQMERETANAIPQTQKGPLRPFERGLVPQMGEP